MDWPTVYTITGLRSNDQRGEKTQKKKPMKTKAVIKVSRLEKLRFVIDAFRTLACENPEGAKELPRRVFVTIVLVTRGWCKV